MVWGNGPMREVSGKMPEQRTERISNALYSNERKFIGRSGKPERQQPVSKQDDSAVDVGLSNQLIGRRRGRSGGSQPVPERHFGTDAGRGEWQRRRGAVADHGRRHE